MPSSQDDNIIDAEVLEEESSELLVQPGGIAPLTPIMKMEVAKARLDDFQKMVDFYLVEGEDYGIIPGTQKKTLFKPGADKLCEIYALTDRYEEIRSTIDWKAKPALFDYELRCILSRGERDITVGMGSCSSYESKYRYRDAERKCPECGKETIIKGKASMGGGWVCWRKKGGCGEKYAEEDPAILDQPIGQVENPDICDLKNTIIKMAKKRAKHDAVLAATRSSGIFAQVDDDEPDDDSKAAGKPGAKPASAKPAEYITEAERRVVLGAANRVDMSIDDVKKYLHDSHSVGSTTKMTREIAKQTLRWLEVFAAAKRMNVSFNDLTQYLLEAHDIDVASRMTPEAIEDTLKWMQAMQPLQADAALEKK